MRLKLLFILTILCTLCLTNTYSEPLGTTGKIKGKVIDAKTNLPLPGAVVKLEGTNMGASTDDAGEYVILNIPVGTYRVQSSYVGYKTEVQTDVKISADITTTVDFSLSEVVVQTDTVEIVAKRNSISPDQSGKVITQETIENNGIRGIENIAAKTAGVVQDERGGTINIRGGRENETKVIIDGVETTNPLSGTSTAYVSNNLLQELAVLTGGFSAEYGNVLSGVINVTTKSGSSKYTGSAEVISDVLVKKISQGYNLYNVNLGGPIIPTKKLANFLTFYGGVERDYLGVAGPSWITPELGLPDDRLPGYDMQRWSGNGKVTFDFSQLNKKLNLKFIAGTNISRTISRNFVQSYMLYNWFRNQVQRDNNDQVYGKVTHQITDKIFYDVQFNWFRTKSQAEDPFLGENLLWYGDPAHVPGLNTKGSRIQLDPYSLFAKPNRTVNSFTKSETSYLEGSFNLTAQIKANEFKFGGNLKYHTIRNYEVGPVGLASFVGPNGEPPPRAIWDGAVALANYWGYSYDGSSKNDRKPTEGDPDSFDGAKHPIIGALYLQDKIEFKDFTINAGLRFDYLDANTWRIKDLTNVVHFGTGVDTTQLDMADFDVKSKPTYAFSPRLGLSFPVTDRTIFHAQYGRFIQLPQLQYLYNGFQNLNYWIKSAGFSGSFGNPNLKPEKTTSYEIGIKQTLGDRLSVDATAFYKETEDLIGIKKYPQLPNQIQVYENQDYGVIRGVDLSVELRRTSGLALSIAYSLSYASGTGSDPNSAGTAAWLGTEQPKFTFPLDFDQRHTGSINVDYRFGKEGLPKGVWGHILSRLGINLLYSFNSGRPYSKKDPSANPFASTGSGAQLESTINGATGPWNHRLDLKIDKTVSIWKLDFNFYAYIINVLNTELVSDVWPGSGDPGNTGYLTTENGMNLANSYDTDSDPLTSSQEFNYLYGLRSKAITNYGPPRQVRFGIKVNF